MTNKQRNSLWLTVTTQVNFKPYTNKCVTQGWSLTE